MKKLLIGGSPCTHWSIAQTKDRETLPTGIGWELFLNFCIALKKYQPDYFIYENNKSMSPAIRAEISRQFGFDPVLLNSSLVSAQNRERLYWVGKRMPDGTYVKVDIEQPEDLGIVIRDILETGEPLQEKGFTLKANGGCGVTVQQAVDKKHFPRNAAAEPVNVTVGGKAQCLRATYYKDGIRNMVGNTVDRRTCVAEPVGVRRLGGLYGQHTRWGVFDTDGKVPCLTASAGMGGGHIPMCPLPVEASGDKTSGGATTPIRVGSVNGGGQGNRLYSAEGKSCAVTAQGSGLGGNAKGLYVCRDDGTVIGPVFEVKDGMVTIKGKQFPIKLADGFYIIRKLSVLECMRLQTVPETYIFPVSATQAYKMLGNGWTVDVIVHIMRHLDGILDEPVEVLSMYDGMSCGHIALDKLGVQVARYYATEIDKYAIQTTQANYPDTIQLGDAFQVRDDNWQLPEPEKEGAHA